MTTATVTATAAAQGPSQQITQIKRWFEAAVPSPENINITTQIGVHIEEVSEMLEALRAAALNQDTIDQLTLVMDVLGHASKRFKSGGFQIDLRHINRPELLDALCDQIVTAIGVGHMLEMNIEGGVQEVANSNDSKFDADGTPIFNTHRKIMKGPNYVAPDLSKYV